MISPDRFSITHEDWRMTDEGTLYNLISYLAFLAPLDELAHQACTQRLGPLFSRVPGDYQPSNNCPSFQGQTEKVLVSANSVLSR